MEKDFDTCVQSNDPECLVRRGSRINWSRSRAGAGEGAGAGAEAGAGAGAGEQYFSRLEVVARTCS